MHQCNLFGLRIQNEDSCSWGDVLYHLRMGTGRFQLCASLFHNPTALCAACTYSKNITSSQDFQAWLSKFEETRWFLVGSPVKNWSHKPLGANSGDRKKGTSPHILNVCLGWRWHVGCMPQPSYCCGVTFRQEACCTPEQVWTLCRRDTLPLITTKICVFLFIHHKTQSPAITST